MARALFLIATLFLSTESLTAQTKPKLVLDTGAHNSSISDCAFTADNLHLISAAPDDQAIRVWDVKTGESIKVLRFPGKPYHAHLTLDGRKLLTAVGFEKEKKVSVFRIDVETWQVDKVIRCPTFVSGTRQLYFSPDGTHAAINHTQWANELNQPTPSRAYVWNLSTEKWTSVFSHARSAITALALSPDNRTLLVCPSEWPAQTVEVESGASTLVPVLSKSPQFGFRSAAWSSDGKKYAVAGGAFDDGVLLVANRDGSSPREFKLPDVSVCSFSRDGKHVLATQPPPLPQLFAPDRSDESTNVSLIDLSTGKRQDAVEFKAERSVLRFSRSAPATAMDSENRRMVFAKGDGELHLLTLAKPHEIRRMGGRSDVIVDCAWRKDGNAIGWGPRQVAGDHSPPNSFQFDDLALLSEDTQRYQRAIARAGAYALEDDCVIEDDVRRQVPLLSIFKGTAQTLLPPNGAAFATHVGVWQYDLSGWKNLDNDLGKKVTKSWELGHIVALSPSPNNQYLLALQANGILHVLKPDRAEPFFYLLPLKGEWIVWTPEGYYAASPGGEKLMGWQVDNGTDKLASFYPASQFRKTLYRPDVIKLLLKAGSLEKALELADAERPKASERAEVVKVLPPKVRLTTPERSLGVKVATLEVKASADSTGNHPVTELHLMIEGRPLPLGRVRIENPKLGEATASWNITLAAGKQRLSVRADSAASSAISEEIVVTYQPPDPVETIKLPSLYVLAVGISDYPKELKLNYAHKDAQALAQTLQTHSKPLYEKVEVKELLDAQATQREIRKGISWLAKQMTQRDVGILFLAGHGEIAANSAFYYLPADIDPEDIAATGLAGDEIKNALAAMPGKIIFMLDACHSGGFENKKRNARSLTDDLIRDLVADERGVIALCASTGRQFALESNEHRHGMFTLAIIEALQGKATKVEGAVYLHHLDAYVTDRVKELSQGRQSPTTARPASVRSFPLSRP